jgi:hypothetical protein
MLNSDALRRLVAVVLVVAALVALPAAPALAAGSDDGSNSVQAASGDDDPGLVEGVIDWLLGVLGGGDEGDLRGGFDPNGRS